MKLFLSMILFGGLIWGGYYVYSHSTDTNESETFPIAYTCRDGNEFQILFRSTSTIRIQLGTEKAITLDRSSSYFDDYRRDGYQALFTGNSSTIKKDGITKYAFCTLKAE